MISNKCSRAGCSEEAIKLIEWRNPKVHQEGRIKLWAACDEHLSFLVDYLSARDFYLGVREFESVND